MNNKRNMLILLVIVGLVIFVGSSRSVNSQVSFGLRYHSGPVSVYFGDYPCYYPGSYYYAPSYYEYHPRYHRRWSYYEHDRGWHRGWYKHHRHR